MKSDAHAPRTTFDANGACAAGWVCEHRWPRVEQCYRAIAESIGTSSATQGMMIVDNTTKRCRLGEQAGKNLVYVEYLEKIEARMRE